MKNVKVKDFDGVFYPMEYPTEYIKVYKGFNEELKKIIRSSGYERDFTKKYKKSLIFLEQLKHKCILNRNLFECLKNEDGLHSIRLFGNINIRILFIFRDDINVVILLNCFIERDSSEYDKAKEIAHFRKKQIST